MSFAVAKYKLTSWNLATRIALPMRIRKDVELQVKRHYKLLTGLAALALAASTLLVGVPAYASSGTNTCTGPGNAGATCIWIDADYGSEQADFFGANADFTKQDCDDPLNCLPDGTWNDEASSGYNNGGGLNNAALWRNANWSGYDECLRVHMATSNTEDFANFGFNDQASSNSWYPTGSTTQTCNHID